MTSVSAQSSSAAAIRIRARSKGLDAVDILVFLIPCLQLIRIKVIGVLNGSDLMMLAVFCYLAFRGRLRIAEGEDRQVDISLRFTVACFAIASRIWSRHSVFADYARGWSNIGLTLVDLAVLWTLLYGRPRRLVLYGWGLVVGGVLFFSLIPMIK